MAFIFFYFFKLFSRLAAVIVWWLLGSSNQWVSLGYRSIVVVVFCLFLFVFVLLFFRGEGLPSHHATTHEEQSG